MNQSKVKFADVTLSLPEPWCDITEDLGSGAPPTLARGADGSGVLQFSTARYVGGQEPRVTVEALTELLANFEKERGLHRTADTKCEHAANVSVAADFLDDPYFMRAYYVSDGRNVALITYVCEKTTGDLDRELKEADRIVRSVAF